MSFGGDWSKKWAQLQLKQEQIDQAEKEAEKHAKKMRELKRGVKSGRNQLRVLINSVQTE